MKTIKIFLSISLILLIDSVCYSQILESYNSTMEPTFNKVEYGTSSSQLKSVLEDTRLSDDNAMIGLLEFDNEDINVVLDEIAQETGYKFIKYGDIKGHVTLSLRNINAKDALQIIFDMAGYAYKREVDSPIDDFSSGEEGKETITYHVMTPLQYEMEYGYPFGKKMQTRVVKLNHLKVEEVIDLIDKMMSPEGKIIYSAQSNTIILMDSFKKLESMEMLIKKLDIPLETENFRLRHADPEEVLKKIQNLLTKDVGQTRFDKRTNSVVVTDTQLKLKEISRLVQEMDKQDKGLLVETKILQIVLNEEHEMGIDWEAIVSDYQSLNVKEKDSEDKKLKGKLSLGSVSEEDYKVLLEALEIVGEINTISNTKMTVVNDEEFYISVTLDNILFQDENNKEIILSDKKGEIKFYFTPSIVRNDELKVGVRPEILLEKVDGKGNKEVMVSGKFIFEGDAVVEVKEKAAIVLGSLFEEVNTSSIKKIPLLGDLPFLGVAFRRQGQRMLKTEIIVFVTLKKIVRE